MRQLDGDDLEEVTREIERERADRLGESWVRRTEDELNGITHIQDITHKIHRSFDRVLSITLHQRASVDVFDALDDVPGIEFKCAEPSGVGRLSVICQYPERPPTQ